MEVLVDTHVLVWWMEDTSRLSRRAKRIMSDVGNRVLISAAVGWELAIKISTGKIKPPSSLDGLERTLKENQFSELPIGMEMAVRAGLLPPHHRDPFDRILVAQAQVLNIPILSADTLLGQYDVKRLW